MLRVLRRNLSGLQEDGFSEQLGGRNKDVAAIDMNVPALTGKLPCGQSVIPLVC